jgi:hypothetical protein
MNLKKLVIATLFGTLTGAAAHAAGVSTIECTSATTPVSSTQDRVVIAGQQDLDITVFYKCDKILTSSVRSLYVQSLIFQTTTGLPYYFPNTGVILAGGKSIENLEISKDGWVTMDIKNFDGTTTPFKMSVEQIREANKAESLRQYDQNYPHYNG